MSPETALTELRAGLDLALMVGGAWLVVVLIVGVGVGIVQAATQINEPTVAFIAKAVAITITLAAMGGVLIAEMVDFTVALFQRIPHLIG